METYVTTMYRNGERSSHSYVLGIYSKKDKALKEALKEEINRGGKYKAEIIICPTNQTLEDESFKEIKSL